MRFKQRKCQERKSSIEPGNKPFWYLIFKYLYIVYCSNTKILGFVIATHNCYRWGVLHSCWNFDWPWGVISPNEYWFQEPFDPCLSMPQPQYWQGGGIGSLSCEHSLDGSRLALGRMHHSVPGPFSHLVKGTQDSPFHYSQYYKSVPIEHPQLLTSQIHT